MSDRHPAFDRILGDAPALREALERASQAAVTPWPVLVLGETGTGKTLLAEAIHAASGRSGKLVSLNCAALSPQLVESELFGYVKGAFTGADRDSGGLFRAADGGTLFLDEIGDLSADAQAKLLRALESGMVRAIGAGTETTVDVRIIGATHRPLNERVAAGAFRQDLYYRINSFVVELPPLRDRSNDIAALASAFLASEGDGVARRFDAAALERLRAHEWPGNLRELQSVVRQAAVTAGDAAEVGAAHLPTLQPAPGTPGVAGALRRGTDLAEALRSALAASGQQARERFAAFLVAFANAHGRHTITRPAMVELLRELRGSEPSDNKLQLEWNRQIRPRIIDAGLGKPTRRYLEIDVDACHSVLAIDRDGQPVESAPAGPAPTAGTTRPTATAPEVARTNLPARTPVLFGRETVQRELETLLGDPNGPGLVTLTGPGGVGKTTLGLATARGLLPQMPDGVWFVDLSEARGADDIRMGVAGTLGIQLDPTEAAQQLESALIAGGAQLLVLDNFEQIAVHADETVGAWRRAATRTRFLVTSRATLGLQGEHRVPLDPLAAPGPPPADALPTELERYDSVRLLVARARAAVPDFELTTDNAPHVARICAAVGGLPLAIEMAAARLKVLSPERLSARIAQALDVLRSSRRDVPDHQRAMRDTFDWSFDLLNAAERETFLRLCQFRAGFSLETAEGVLGDEVAGELLIDTLESLIDKSFVRRLDSRPPRYDFFPVLREYGQERGTELLADEVRAVLGERHARWFADLADTWCSDLQTGDGPAWRQALTESRADRLNLITAIEWAGEADDEVLLGELVTHTAELMLEHGETLPVRPWLDRIADSPDDALPTGLRLQILYLWAATQVLNRPGDPRVTERFDAAIGLARNWNNGRPRTRAIWLARALSLRGALYASRRDFEQSAAAIDEGEALARAHDLPAILGRVLYSRGHLAMKTGDTMASQTAFAKTEELARLTGRERLLALTLPYRAVAQARAGHINEARKRVGEALALAGSLNDLTARLSISQSEVEIEVRYGDPARGLELAVEREKLAGRIGLTFGAIGSIAWQARAMLLLDRPADALARLDDAIALRQTNPTVGQERPLTIFRGLALIGTGHYAEARATAEQLLEEVPAHGEAGLYACAILAAAATRRDDPDADQLVRDAQTLAASEGWNMERAHAEEAYLLRLVESPRD